MADISQLNGKLIGGISSAFTSSKFINGIGYFLLGVIIISLGGWYMYYTIQKKQYNKKVTVFEVVGGYFDPIIRDMAKSVKIGKGGFEILYLKKQKTWKIAYGGRVGKNDYYFFINTDGYWYNSRLSANIQAIDKQGGLIPIVTTNPSMRGQYTSLEKQVDHLHGDKVKFWDRYGVWVLGIGYLMIVGLFSWLSYREIGGTLGQASSLAQSMKELADSMKQLAVNYNANNGLVKG